MEEDLFAAPPISGNNVPYKDLMPDIDPDDQPMRPMVNRTEKSNKGLKIYMAIITVILIIVLVILAVVIYMLSQKQPPVVVTQPTAMPSAAPVKVESSLPANVLERVKKLEENTNNVDLKELDLSYPQLDLKIRF